MVRVTPYMGARAMRDMRLHGQRLAGERLFGLLTAMGHSRQGEALRQLSTIEVPADPLGRLGLSIALLALGDATRTATITQALAEGPVEHRRLAARALSRMRQRRPLSMLEGHLADEDPWVQLWACRALVDYGFVRARRGLIRLAQSGPKEVRTRAARTLVSRRVRLGSDVALSLPEPMRGRGFVFEAARGNRTIRQRAGREVASTEEARRAAGFAALAHFEPVPRIKRLTARAVTRHGVSAEAELAMTLALAGDEAAIGTLRTLGPSGASRALQVLWSFSGANDLSAVPEATATAIAKRVQAWLAKGQVEPRQASRALRALERITPEAATEAARARLGGVDGWDLRTALRILGRRGARADVSRIVAVAGKETSPRTRVEAWRAAARICQR